MGKLVARCSDRPADEDWGEVSTEGLWCSFGRRPPSVQGPQNACHPVDLELALTARGRGFANIGKHSVTTGPNEYSIVPPGVDHSSHTSDAEEIGLCLHISSRLLEQAENEVGLSARHRSWSIGAYRISGHLASVLDALRSETLRADAETTLIEELTDYVCGELLRRHRSDWRYPAALSSAGHDMRLEHAVDFMHAELDRPLSLAELAKASHLSRFRFAHLFRAKFGISPYSYLQRLRLQRAAERLCSTHLPLARIAHDLGFGSSSRFSESFRKFYGETPSQFRRRRQTHANFDKNRIDRRSVET